MKAVVDQQGLEPWTVECKSTVIAILTKGPFSMGTWTRTKGNCIPNAAFYLLNYTHILEEDIGLEPKPT